MAHFRNSLIICALAFGLGCRQPGGVTPLGAPDAVTAQGAALSVAEDGTVQTALVATSTRNLPLTFEIEQGPAHGTASISGSTLTYTAGANYFGSDSLTYVATDGVATSSPAQVSITVVDTTGPVASPQSVSVKENTPLSLTLSASDSAHNPLTYSIATGPGHGTLSTLSGASLTYTPNSNFRGSDSFTFAASDGNTSSSAKVSISVVESEVPTASPVSTTTSENQSVTITLSAQETDGATLTYLVASPPAHGTLSAVTGNKVIYSPASAYVGADSFTYSASNGTNVSSPAKVSVTITAATPGPLEWAFEGGSPVYGGVPSYSSPQWPGARMASSSWKDKSGNFYLFGGSGAFDATTGALTNLHSDIWKYAGSQWNYVAGPKSENPVGVYGTKGTPSAANYPGGRTGAMSWVDANGEVWMYGGFGLNADPFGNELNDLWRFDGTNWAWMGGDYSYKSYGGNYPKPSYGSKGVASSTNWPGARDSASAWTDAAGNLWLFGGNGIDANGELGELNDLWKFDGKNWTWMGGSTSQGAVGVYGTIGITSAENQPGGRFQSVNWLDAAGNVWIFGGSGVDSNPNSSGVYGGLPLNDLWKFDGKNWTWISGSSTAGQLAVYGTKGVAASGNVPGAKSGAIGWTDASGNLWLFGGTGPDDTGNLLSLMNEVWKFDGKQWEFLFGTNDAAGVYGQIGVPSSNNIPESRELPVGWSDGQGNFFIYGGIGAVSDIGPMGDLWKLVP